MLSSRKAAAERLRLRSAAARIAIGLCVGGALLLAGFRLVPRMGSEWRPTKEPAAQRAFYFWKTQWLATSASAASLRALAVGRLYLRLFDVDWDPALQAAQPIAPLVFAAPLPRELDIVPVVFVTNQVFLRTAPAAVDGLAERVLRKILATSAAHGITPREVQLDCDWSDATRARYFRFLDVLRRALHEKNQILSSTIRLHQIKYAARTGVPPVDRGMLMFYNFGPLYADAPRSSIYNTEDAQRYAAHIAGYALPLDLSLPLFSWAVHARDGNVVGVIEKLDAADIEHVDAFRRIHDGRYQAARGVFLRGHYFIEGDELRIEQTTPHTTLQAAITAARGARGQKHFATIAFFDLDERNLRHYVVSDLQNILAVFR
ncbi:MAG: hypothetical protein JNJ46_13525 [Myxococcales bacterium]|nr:hypothetical protein [Myxococcales bacterium]